MYGALLVVGVIGSCRDSGHSKHSSCDKYDTKYWNLTSIYQLWRQFAHVSADRDGFCPECEPWNKIQGSVI